MHMRRRCAVALAFVAGVVLAVAVAAQAPQEPTPTFRADTTVVPLDVRVLDKQGRPVTDLTVADFTVIEDGKPQRIEHFARQELTPESVLDDQPLQRRAATLTEAPRPVNRRVFLIYLGRGELTGPSDGIDGIIHLVRDRLLPQDRVAIMAWNRATDFTTDRTSGLALLERFKSGYRQIERELVDFYTSPVYFYGDRQIPAYIQADIDAVFAGPNVAPMRRVNAPLEGSAAEEESLRQTYDLFNAPASDEFSEVQRDIVGVDLSTFLGDTAQTMQDQSNLYAGIEYLRHLEGEKHLIWLAEIGLRRSFRTPEELDRDLGRAAADARVVLNVIRAGGTEVGRRGMTMTADIQGPRGPRYSGTAFATLMLPAASSRMLAEITGGRSDANRFPTASVAADHIEQASRFAYLLGYYPTNAAWNGRFRNIEVRIDRKDVTVLVRRGYYARPNVGPLDRERVVSFGRIAAAAGDAREIPDLGLEATADNSRTGDGRVVRLAVTIDVARVFFAKADDRNTATLEIAAFCLDGRQRGVGDVRTTIALELSDARLREVRESGVPVSLTIPVSAQADSLKLVVYDYAADLTGSRNVDVD